VLDAPGRAVSEGPLKTYNSQTLAEDHCVSDFIGVKELAALTGFAPKTIYFQHSTQHGALVPILSKLGRKLGAWRGDYETWRNKQRKLQSDS
jgi:hypothetical protein